MLPNEDSFYWGEGDNLDGYCFTITVLEHSGKSFARQAAQQYLQAQHMMEEWDDYNMETTTIYTADEVSTPPSLRDTGICKTDIPIGFIPIRISNVPTPLLTGDLDIVSQWMATPDLDECEYDTDESWECECGESYSASDF